MPPTGSFDRMVFKITLGNEINSAVMERARAAYLVYNWLIRGGGPKVGVVAKFYVCKTLLKFYVWKTLLKILPTHASTYIDCTCYPSHMFNQYHCLTIYIDQQHHALQP